MNAIKQGYKQTKVGIIPEDWEVVKLGDICKFQQGVQVDLELQKNYPIDGYVKFLRIENYTQNSNDFRYIPINLSQNKTIAENEIAIVRYGATAGYIARGYNGVLANNLFKLIPNLKFIKNEFLYFCLTSQKVFNFFQSEMAGGAMPALSFGIVEVLKLYLPPLKQQEKIAEILTTWDEAISLHVKLIEEKEQLKIGLMQKLLSGEVRFAGFCDEWENISLNTLFDFKKGQELSKEKLDENGIFECILYGELYTTYSEVIKNVQSKTNIQEGIKSKIDDILIPASTTTSAIDLAIASTIQKNDVLLGGDINILRKKKNNINGEFIAKYLTHIKKIEIAKYAQGITIIHLYTKDFKHLKIKLPSLLEQQKIAEVLSLADDELNLLKKELEELKQQKKGLMQKLLTGEVRVKI